MRGLNVCYVKHTFIVGFDHPLKAEKSGKDGEMPYEWSTKRSKRGGGSGRREWGEESGEGGRGEGRGRKTEGYILQKTSP